MMKRAFFSHTPAVKSGRERERKTATTTTAGGRGAERLEATFIVIITVLSHWHNHNHGNHSLGKGYRHHRIFGQKPYNSVGSPDL